ncbi:MAG TPA: 3-phosphoshikimate 1-carboxyvinyltransferase [Acidimicrobiia bacterium]|nr:3-phosphoshikimate 1-carboxyvinyltransferase [Acidimicrobiia bacterium]
MSVPTDLVLSGPHPLRGRLRVPGDKGMSHRALLFAAMADGRSRVMGLAGGDDVSRTRGALAQLGVDSTVAGSAVTVAGRSVTGFTEPTGILDCGNSGTTIRLLSGLLAGRPFLSVLTGDDSLVRRPMARVVAPLRAMGARVDGRADGTMPPLTVRGGGLIGTTHLLTVASAQVKTAVLLAGLQADGTTEISEPAPSRDHTERMLAALGAPIIRVDERAVRVTAGAPQPFDFDVPGDPSSAAFWVVAATITPGSELVVEDVALNPARIAFVDVLVRMGAAIEMVTTGERLGEPVGELRVRSAPLHGTTVEGATIPWVIDEIPALAVAAAFADGVTEFRDAGELRVKESDRIATVGELVTRLGVGVESGADHLVVRGGRPAPAALDSHGDHRVAMAGAVAANALEGEMVVRGWRAVASSYPEFTEDLATLTGGATR